MTSPLPFTRLAVYCDFTYRVDGDVVTAQRPFSLFLLGLTSQFARVVLVGRLEPAEEPFPYEMRDIEFEPLPYYASGADFGAVLRGLPAALRRFWRVLDRVDVVWILGPNPPQAIAFVLLAVARRRRVVLGVRQQLPALVRRRHPRRPVVWLAASTLDRVFMLLARRLPVVVVGPDLARRYRRSRAVHTSLVSLLEERDILGGADDRRDYGADELRLLSVGRLDPEKNPLLLPLVLRDLLRRDPRWRLEVCGDGMLTSELTRCARELGLASRVTQHGHVPFGPQLWDHYRSCHALIHVSFTEGMPQVLLEAFASRLPVVGTAVGSVQEVMRGNGLLVPPGDSAEAAVAIQRLIDDSVLRVRCVDSAAAFASRHTLRVEVEGVASFLRGRT